MDELPLLDRLLAWFDRLLALLDPLLALLDPLLALLDPLLALLDRLLALLDRLLALLDRLLGLLLTRLLELFVRAPPAVAMVSSIVANPATLDYPPRRDIKLLIGHLQCSGG